MTDDLIFEEPPKPSHSPGVRQGNSPVGRWLASLRDHPGSWAKYPDPLSQGVGTTIRKGRGYGVEAGEFEVRTVNIPDSPTHLVNLYARYTPEG